MQQHKYKLQAALLSGDASTYTISADNLHGPLACIWDGLWYNEDPCSSTLHLQVAPEMSETLSKCFDVLFCHSQPSTSSANRWSYYCLGNENGNCWPQKSCMGDKADRPLQSTWKTARLLSSSVLWANTGSSANKVITVRAVAKCDCISGRLLRIITVTALRSLIWIKINGCYINLVN